MVYLLYRKCARSGEQYGGYGELWRVMHPRSLRRNLMSPVQIDKQQILYEEGGQVGSKSHDLYRRVARSSITNAVLILLAVFGSERQDARRSRRMRGR